MHRYKKFRSQILNLEHWNTRLTILRLEGKVICMHYGIIITGYLLARSYNIPFSAFKSFRADSFRSCLRIQFVLNQCTVAVIYSKYITYNTRNIANIRQQVSACIIVVSNSIRRKHDYNQQQFLRQRNNQEAYFRTDVTFKLYICLRDLSFHGSQAARYLTDDVNSTHCHNYIIYLSLIHISEPTRPY